MASNSANRPKPQILSIDTSFDLNQAEDWPAHWQGSLNTPLDQLFDGLDGGVTAYDAPSNTGNGIVIDPALFGGKGHGNTSGVSYPDTGNGVVIEPALLGRDGQGNESGASYPNTSKSTVIAPALLGVNSQVNTSSVSYAGDDSDATISDDGLEDYNTPANSSKGNTPVKTGKAIPPTSTGKSITPAKAGNGITPAKAGNGITPAKAGKGSISASTRKGDSRATAGQRNSPFKASRAFVSDPVDPVLIALALDSQGRTPPPELIAEIDRVHAIAEKALAIDATKHGMQMARLDLAKSNGWQTGSQAYPDNTGGLTQTGFNGGLNQAGLNGGLNPAGFNGEQTNFLAIPNNTGGLTQTGFNGGLNPAGLGGGQTGFPAHPNNTAGLTVTGAENQHDAENIDTVLFNELTRAGYTGEQVQAPTFPEGEGGTSATATDGSVNAGYSSQESFSSEVVPGHENLNIGQHDSGSAGVPVAAENAIAVTDGLDGDVPDVDPFVLSQVSIDAGFGLCSFVENQISPENRVEYAKIFSEVSRNPDGDHQHPVARVYASALAAIRSCDALGQGHNGQVGSSDVGPLEPVRASSKSTDSSGSDATTPESSMGSLPNVGQAARMPQGVQKRQGRVGAKAKPKAGRGENGFKAEDTGRLEAFLKAYAEEKGMTWGQVTQAIAATGAEHAEHAEMWDRMQGVLLFRDRQAIMRHCRRQFHGFARRGTWTPAEDAELKAAVEKHGHKWVQIGKEIARLPDDARDRYRNYLAAPDFHRGRWSKEEIEAFDVAVAAVEAENRQKYRDETGQSDVDVERKKFLNAETIAARMGHARNRIQVLYRLRHKGLQ